MSLLSKLFGGAGPKQPEPVEHKGFRIFPEPEKVSGGYRIGARIEKDIGGEIQSHQMIRADVLNTQEAAFDASVGKARQMIDEQGEAIFR